LPTPRDTEPFGNPNDFIAHQPVDAPANRMSAMGRKRTLSGRRLFRIGARSRSTTTLACKR
jgi:hypothetical protein